MIEDVNTRKRVSLLTDRAQGATSLNKGEIEVMLHRRLVNKALVGEALNELNPWNN